MSYSQSGEAAAAAGALDPLAIVFSPITSEVPALQCAPQLYELRQTAEKGSGLFAIGPIPRGTLILAEKALFETTGGQPHRSWGEYVRLDEQQKAAYDSLHAFTPEHLELKHTSWTRLRDFCTNINDPNEVENAVAKHVRIMSIFATNNIQITDTQLAVYATASRLNHSCAPNVVYTFNKKDRVLEVRAVRDILPNEELLCSYLDIQSIYYTRSQRNEILRDNFGFTCHCKACSDQTGNSDKRRLLLEAIVWGLKQYDNNQPVTTLAPVPGEKNPYIPTNEQAAFLQAGDVIEYLIQEGIESLPLAMAYHTASAKAMDAKNYDKAMEYCEIEAEIVRTCSGFTTTSWREELLRIIKHRLGFKGLRKYLKDEEVGFHEHRYAVNQRKKAAKRARAERVSKDLEGVE